MIKKLLLKNKILFWLGTIHLVLFLLLLIYLPFNRVIVLGLNSVIKPMKFALSIWTYSWTMIIILDYFENQKKVKIYSLVAVISMSFEQIAITFQALRGEQSHFNKSTIFGVILFATMGIFILIITLWTAYITFIFIIQKVYIISESQVLSIQIGLVYFIIFSLFGGYISGKTGHSVGGLDGGNGLWFLNWNTFYGDLRVAHFFGIHSLQIIPLFAFAVSKFSKKSISKWIWIFSICYLFFVLYTMFLALSGKPFIN